MVVMNALSSSYAFGVYLLILQVTAKLFIGIGNSGILVALFAGIVYSYLHGGISSVREKINVVAVYILLSLLIGYPSLQETFSALTYPAWIIAAVSIAALLVYGLVVYAFFSWGERLQVAQAKKATQKKDQPV